MQHSATGWDAESFDVAVRQGRNRAGRALDRFMPWESYAHLDDDEVAALWAFVGAE